MPEMKYVIMQLHHQIQFVEMPATHAYQLSALHHRLHKELDKLTAANVPELPVAIAECERIEFVHPEYNAVHGLEYINELERSFANIQETAYPLISLLTEIRALQAQLEQWYEEEYN